MTIQQQCAEIVLKKCIQCNKDIPFIPRMASKYKNRQYCTHKCFLDFLKQNGNAQVSSHQMSRTRPWHIFMSMKSRCDNPKSESYKRYGGRGITYCEKWSTFEGFWEDMKENYKDNLTLDRINVNGNYCRENCRWATYIEQANNKTNNRVITYNGETKTLAEWVKKTGIPRRVISYRLDEQWEINKVFNTKLCKTHYKNR